MDRNRKSAFTLPIITLIMIILGLIIAGCLSTQSLNPTQTHAPSQTALITPSGTPAPTQAPPATPTQTSTPPPHLQIDPEKLHGVTIIFWHSWNGDSGRQMAKIIDEFNQVNIWGIHVKAQSFTNNTLLYKEIQTASPTETIPDLISAPLDYLMSIHELHPLVNLSDYVESSQWGLSAQEITDFIPVFWNQDIVANYRFGIPAQRDMNFVFYNLTWAQELGFPNPPATLEQFEKQNCEALAANIRTQYIDKLGTGGWIINNDPMTTLNWMTAFDTQLLAESDKSLVFNSTQTNKTFEYLTSLYSKSCIWLGKTSSPYEYFANRQALFYSGSLDDILPQTILMEHQKKMDQWNAIPYPAQNGNSHVVISGPSYGIPYSTPERQMASWLFIRWLTIARHQALLSESNLWLPVTTSTIDMLAAQQIKYSQWKQAVALIPFAVTPPPTSAWRVAAPVLSDLSWQVFHQPPTPIPVQKLLQQMDETVHEIINHQP